MAKVDLTIGDYSDKAIVVSGNTRDVKEDLKRLGGKYNAKLRDGPGWIFPKTLEGAVRKYIETGEVPVKEARRLFEPADADAVRAMLNAIGAQKRQEQPADDIVTTLENRVYDVEKSLKSIDIILSQLISTLAKQKSSLLVRAVLLDHRDLSLHLAKESGVKADADCLEGRILQGDWEHAKRLARQRRKE